MDTKEMQPDQRVEQTEKSPNEDRLVMLSDGIFAIAATLLVLDIKITNITNITMLSGFLSNFWSQAMFFLITFLVICIYWINHRYIMNTVTRIDSGFLWLNFLFLAFIAFFPVASNLVEVNGEFGEVDVIYTVVIACCGFTSAVLWIYASSRNYLIDSPSTKRNIRVRTVLFLITPTFFLLSLLLMKIPGFPPDDIYYSWIFVGVIQFMVARIYRLRFLKSGEDFTHEGFTR